MRRANIKKLIPLQIRIYGRHLIDAMWTNRRLNHPMFGLLFDITSGGIYKAFGCSFEIPKDLTTLGFRTRFFFHSYEETDAKLALKHFRPEDSVLELGACLGFLGCITNKILKEPHKHIVVEANPRLIPWIKRNRNRNNAHFHIEHCLVSETSDGTFFIHDLIVGGSAVRKTNNLVTVPVKSVASFDQFQPTALFINIEGAELEFLQQARHKLKHVRIIIIDLHEFIIGREACNECREILENSGFQLVESSGSLEVWEQRGGTR